MISRFQAIANKLVLEHKKLSGDGKADLIHQNWTPHNVKSIYLAEDECKILYYDNRAETSINLKLFAHSDEDKDVFRLLYSSSPALKGISANIKNIREFVVFYDPQKENLAQLAQDMHLDELKQKDNIFQCLSVIFVNANTLSLAEYEALLKKTRKEQYQEFLSRYGSKTDKVMLKYSDPVQFFWSLQPPSANDSRDRTSTFTIKSEEGTKIKRAYSDLYLLKQRKELKKGQDWFLAAQFKAKDRKDTINVQYFSSAYPADEELRKFVSDNYWKPLAAQAILSKLYPEVKISDEVREWTKVLTSIISMKKTAQTYFSCRTWLKMLLNPELKKNLISVCTELSGTLSSSLLDNINPPEGCEDFFKIMSKNAIPDGSPQAYKNYCKFCSLVLAYYVFATFLLFPYKNIKDEINTEYILERKQNFNSYPLPVKTNIAPAELATVIARMNETSITPKLRNVVEEIYAQGILDRTRDDESALTYARLVVYKGGN